MELRVFERREQEFLEPGVEFELVLGLDAGVGAAGGNLVRVLREVGLDLVEVDDGNLLVRGGERIRALVEATDHFVIVVLLQTRQSRGLRFVQRDGQSPFGGGLHLLLQPAPQPCGVDVAIDGRALRPQRRAGELVGAGRRLHPPAPPSAASCGGRPVRHDQNRC